MPKGISRNPRTDKRRVKNRISKVKPSKAEPNFVEVGPPMTFKQAMYSVLDLRRSRELAAKEEFGQLPTLRLEEFKKRAIVQAEARKQRDEIKDKLTLMVGLCSLHDVVKMLAELADDKAYETQDHDDDLICMVLEKTEKQIWGLTLSKQHRAQQK
jgi:hypothetical protein